MPRDGRCPFKAPSRRWYAAASRPRSWITALPEGRLAPMVGTAAYFVVAEVVRRSGARAVTLGATRRDGQLVVEIQGDGHSPEALVDLEDRVGALDGRLEVLHQPGGRVRIRAEIPCES